MSQKGVQSVLSNKLLLFCLVVCCSLSTIVFGGQVAQAAQVDAITNVTTTPSDVSSTEYLRSDIMWSVPDSAVGGDHFTLTIPSRLTFPGSGFELRDAGNNLVATASIVGNTVTFTLTSFADTNTGVNGTAYFESFVSGAVVGETVPLTFQTVSQTFNRSVDIRAFVVDRSQAYKNGYWTGVDEGTSDPEEAVLWGIDLPQGTYTGMTISDTLDVGQQMNCSSFEFYEADVNGNGEEVTARVSSSVPQIVSCDSNGFEISIPSYTNPNGILIIVYTVNLTNSTLGTYQNAVDLSWTTPGGPEAQTINRTLARTYGGTGGGTTSSDSSGSTTGSTAGAANGGNTILAPNAGVARSYAGTPQFIGTVLALLFVGIGLIAWLACRRKRQSLGYIAYNHKRKS